MPTHDLKSDEGLTRAMQEAEATKANPEWRSDLGDFLRYVRSADAQLRRSEEFHRSLWEQNPVSGAGMGQVNVEPAIQDEGFRQWLVDQANSEIPDDPDRRTVALTRLHRAALERLDKLCNRTPQLKLLRLFAALFPNDFTTVTSKRALRRLQRQMGFEDRVDPVVGNRRILDRLAEVMGQPDPENLDVVVTRMTLPWMLIELSNENEPEATTITEPGGNERLNPLPGARRRKGLTAISGYFTDMLSTLEFVKDEPSPEELLDYIRSEKSHLKETSIRTHINSLRSEFNVLRREGDRYVLTERGEALLETGDPDELRDWLLTRIFGIDHILVALSERDLSRDEVYQAVRNANSSWKTNFGPSAIVAWLLHLGIVVYDADEGLYSLTDRGAQWREWITWEPELLASSDPEYVEVAKPNLGSPEVNRPTLDTIMPRMTEAATFPSELITSLHLGLWADTRRHFAILSGLSGSGKTLLARRYGEALTNTNAGTPTMLTIPVQPGWYDPSPLLGYVNPLSRDSYEGTAFLDLLISAAENPEEPHVAILDEMNLSHPEQYLAPLLSAMETGDALELHNQGDHFDGIPGRIPYPGNLVLIGTVNMDETTLGISDKVLDRAFTLEFWDIEVENWSGWGKSDHLRASEEAFIRDVLSDLMSALKPARLHFGWRTINEIVGFMEMQAREGGSLSATEALDAVIYAKLLPKLRGEDAPRFRNALDTCTLALKGHGLSRSAEKVQMLKDDLESTGSARFWR